MNLTNVRACRQNTFYFVRQLIVSSTSLLQRIGKENLYTVAAVEAVLETLVCV